MGHFAQINADNTVIQVIVADQEFINTGLVGDPASWLQTSYNTFGGIHKLGGTPLRKNYAGFGYTYDADRDAFIPPCQYTTWILNEDTCQWIPPVEYPTDGNSYVWDDATVSWIVYVEPLVEPVVEPVVEPILEPVVEPVVEPILEPILEPVVEPTVEPVIEPVVEPILEPVVEPTVEPVIEPVVEPILEPTVEPV